MAFNDQVKVTLEGIPELKHGSAELFKRIGVEAPKEFGKVAENVANTVRGQVPTRTGALAGTVKGRGFKRNASVRMGAARAKYARFVEFGGRGHPAGRPGNYLMPAAFAAEPDIIDAANRVARQEIARQHWPST